MKCQLATYRNAARKPPSASSTSAGAATAVYTAAVTTSVTNAAGQQPPEPAGVEAPEADAPGRAEVAEQQLGHEVAREHEEHVDADEAAGEAR